MKEKGLILNIAKGLFIVPLKSYRLFVPGKHLPYFIRRKLNYT